MATLAELYGLNIDREENGFLYLSGTNTKGESFKTRTSQGLTGGIRELLDAGLIGGVDPITAAQSYGDLSEADREFLLGTYNEAQSTALRDELNRLAGTTTPEDMPSEVQTATNTQTSGGSGAPLNVVGAVASPSTATGVGSAGGGSSGGGGGGSTMDALNQAFEDALRAGSQQANDLLRQNIAATISGNQVQARTQAGIAELLAQSTAAQQQSADVLGQAIASLNSGQDKAQTQYGAVDVSEAMAQAQDDRRNLRRRSGDVTTRSTRSSALLSPKALLSRPTLLGE